MLRFIRQNSKLIHGQVIFDLPAGWACPFALTCLSKADKETGKITDGEYGLIRCYKASLEAVFTPARKIAWENFDAIRACSNAQEMFNLLNRDLIEGKLYRLHTGGDFYSQDYFDAWLMVANHYPYRTFYAYTKAIPFWVKRLKDIPANLILNASYGGKFDALIPFYKLKSVTIVNSHDEARLLGLEVDHDDFLAYGQTKSFALLIHGNGKPGSLQAKLHAAKNRRKKQS